MSVYHSGMTPTEVRLGLFCAGYTNEAYVLGP